MKHILKTTLSLLLAACCLFGTVGCAAIMDRLEGATPGEILVVEGKSALDPATANAAIPEEPNESAADILKSMIEKVVPDERVSDERIMDLYWDLFDKACSASENGDYEAYKALYYDTDESVIQSNFNNSWRQYDEYDRRDGFVAGSKDGYYWIVRTHYIVSGTYPNASRDSLDGYSLTHYENGRLQFAYGDEAVEVLNPLSVEIMADFFERVSPGFTDSFNGAANFADFVNNNYLFLNSDMVYKGSYSANLLCMWQLQNGDVGIALVFTNGTNQNISSRIRVTVKDDTLGTVIDEQLNETVATRANHSQVRMFRIPASHVKTGMQTWGSLHSNVHTDNN